MLIPGMILISGCKGGDTAIDEAAPPEGDTSAAEVTEAEETEEDSSGEELDKDGSSTVEEEQTSQEETEKGGGTEEIPAEITEKIEAADNYFNDGMYAEAAKEYRDAVRAINDSDISIGLNEELQEMISQNHQDAENITETARTHHSNAMTLKYEGRTEEVVVELEAALEIYPKYQIAIDMLDSLEALKGLE